MTLYKNKYRIESIRRWNWDYTGDGMYFITICTQRKYPFFGRVADEAVQLSEIGLIAENQWRAVPSHYDNVTLDEFIVMPDHFHAIVTIRGPKKVPRLITRDAPLREPLRSPEAGSLSNVIRQYKAGVTWLSREAGVSFSWQAGFYDSIITIDDLEDVRKYIRDNPKNWGKDREEGRWQRLKPWSIRRPKP